MCGEHSIKGPWDVSVKGTHYAYQGLHPDFANYIGEGLRYSELTKASYLKERVKVI